MSIPSAEENKDQPVPAETSLVQDRMERVIHQHRQPEEEWMMYQKRCYGFT